MNEDIIQIVKQQEFYYHFTKKDNLISLVRGGLDPRFCSPEYKVWNEPDVLRYCTAQKIDKTRRMVRDRHQNPETWEFAPLIQLRIEASSLTNRFFGLDLSCELQASIAGRVGWNDYEGMSASDWCKCIQQGGYVSCYDVIPSAELFILSSDNQYELIGDCLNPLTFIE